METSTLYNGEVVLSLDGRHCYWASVNGREKQKAIGVTSVSGLLDKSGPMKYWAVNLTCDYIKGLLDAEKFVTYDELEIARKQHTIQLAEAADVGTLVHKWCQDFILYQIQNDGLKGI